MITLQDLQEQNRYLYQELENCTAMLDYYRLRRQSVQSMIDMNLEKLEDLMNDAKSRDARQLIEEQMARDLKVLQAAMYEGY